MKNLLNKAAPISDLPDSRFQIFNLRENPFPTQPMINKENNDKRYNGEIYESEIDNGTSDIQFQTDSPYTFPLQTEYRYGTNNMLKQVTPKNDNSIVYLWAYNDQYPVAKIISPENTTISVEIDDSNLSMSDDFGDIQDDVSYLQTLLSSYINDKDYMVTLYTYRPLIGMTSKTDPNGKTTYYEYDAFGRLEYIKNGDGNILNAYDYNYSNSN